MTILNEKTIAYLIKEYTAEGVPAEVIEKLLTDVSERATRKRKKKFPEVLTNANQTSIELKERIDFYNEVVNNTVRKLWPYYSASNLTIPKWAEAFQFVKVVDGVEKVLPISALTTGEYTLTREDFIIFIFPVAVNRTYVQNRPGNPTIERKSMRVPVAHLWNDPVTVAQHTRKLIAAAREEDSVLVMKTASEEVNELNEKLEKAIAKLNKVSKDREKLVAKLELKEKKKKLAKLKKQENQS